MRENVPEASGDDFMMLSHLPPLPCLSSLPNLSSVAFSSTPRLEDRHGWRPQPPTPARGKMSPKDRDAESLGAKPRRPSMSAIPRPVRTASTRRSSKSCLTTTDLLLSPEKARRPPQRRSAAIRSENPPSSYHLPRSLLPRSESFLTQFEEFSAIEDAFDTPTKGVPKSQTTPALLSPNKDIPSHRLLRPLDPPLPRSSTYDNFLCPKREKVPREDPKEIFFSNRMTSKGFEKQKTDSRSPYILQGQTTWSLPGEGSTLLSTSGSEVSEVDLRSVFVSESPTYWLGRYTTLLDRLRTKKLIPKPKSRTDNRTASRTTSLKHKNSMEFERAERDIKRLAIETLRSFCQTEAALNSLKKFEEYMSHNDPSSSRRPATIEHEPTGWSQPPVVRQRSEKHPPINPAKPKIRKLSDSLPYIPPNIFRKGPSSNRRDPTVTKSFTVGNFGSEDSFSSPGSGYTSYQHLSTYHSARNMSHHTNISEPRLRAVQDKDPRQNFSKTLPRQSSGRRGSHVEDMPGTTSRAATMPLSEQVASIKLNSESPRKASNKTAKHEVTAVDGGDLQPLDNSSTTRRSPQLTAEDTSTGHSRRFRKSESMKKLFDASIKEIRKMGQRVSNHGGHHDTDEY